MCLIMVPFFVIYLYAYVDRTLLSTTVLASSAWAGLEEEATVDEVEAVRTFSGELPGLVTPLKRERTKPDGNGGTKRFR